MSIALGISIAMGVASLVTGIAGAYMTNKTNKENVESTNALNKQLTEETNAHNEALQREQWEREDTAIQRMVADSQAAGVSPLANLNGSPSSLSTNLVAPTMQTPQVMDLFRSLSQGLGDMSSNAFKGSESEKDRKQQTESLKTTLKSQEDNLKLQLKSASDEAERDRTQNLLVANQSLQELQYTHDNELRMKLNEQFQKSVSAVTGGRSVHFREYFDEGKYKEALTLWSRQYSDRISLMSDLSSKSSTSMNSNTGSLGVNVMGTGANGTQGASELSSESESYSDKDKFSLSAWLADNPMPVFNPYKRSRN